MDEEKLISAVLLDLLEKLLSITESYVPAMDPEDREAWQEISAACADFREGDDE